MDEMPQAEELTARVQFKHLESGNDTFQDVDELTQAEEIINHDLFEILSK